MTANFHNRLTAAVSRQYENFPYPGLPLWQSWLRLIKLQEHYTAAPIWAARLGQHIKHTNCGVLAYPHAPRLLGGCGDSQASSWKLWDKNQVFAIDLSAASLRRSKLRTPFAKNFHWEQADILEYLNRPTTPKFAHMDLYGVLHHLSTPSETLKAMAKQSLPGATIRLMVYNQNSRWWLNELSRICNALQLNPKTAVPLLKTFNKLPLEPAYKNFIQRKLAKPTELVDTFFHERVINWSFKEWSQAWEKAGFQTLALFDRYGELDHLSSPLLHPPKPEDLDDLCAKGIFKNNFEVILWLPAESKLKLEAAEFSLRRLRRLSPPRIWFEFPETTNINLLKRAIIWQNFLSYLENGKVKPIKNLPLQAKQRLARLGAIFTTENKVNAASASALAPAPEPNHRSILNHPASSAEIQKLSDFVKTAEVSERRRQMVYSAINRLLAT